MMQNPVFRAIYSYSQQNQRITEVIKPLYLKLYYELNKGFLRQCFHWFSAGHFLRFMKIKEMMNTTQHPLCLQVGGGYHSIPQWINGDLIAGDIYLDATKKLPFPDSSIDYVYTEEFFEHLSYKEGQIFLREVYRVLKPGGVIRQATPSLRGLIDVYQNKNDFVSREEVIKRHRQNHNKDSNTACYFINDLFRLWGHQFIYDEETIMYSHQAVGFTSVTFKTFGQSEHQTLQNLERHADKEWMKSAFILIIEAVKTENKDN